MGQGIHQNGQMRPAGKLDPYAECIVSMIEADPARSTYSLHGRFMEREKVKISYTTFSKFVAELGYFRDAVGKRLKKSPT
jgi:hypothetical protein